jgi:hypothetical protein
VDWYVCSVGSYHVKQTIDPSMALVENEELKRLLLLDDDTVVRAVAVAVGELESLLEHDRAAMEWVGRDGSILAAGCMEYSFARQPHLDFPPTKCTATNDTNSNTTNKTKHTTTAT